jgi:hypothetical protein
MTDSTDDPLLFENAEWALTLAGLEHHRTGYFIEAGQIGERRPDGLWAWPVHMAEKPWCRPETFAEAFLQAVAAGGLLADADLARSFAVAGDRATRQAVWDHVAREVVGHERRDAPLSLADVITISGEMGRRTGLGQRAGVPAARSTAQRPGAESPKVRLGRIGARALEWLRGGYGTESEHLT